MKTAPMKVAVPFWTYNRDNYKFDVGQRWKRFTGGRAFALKQAQMFRDDVADLTTVPIEKMKIYAPMCTVVCGYCVTIYIEGRSGLKFPAPPTFISGIYLLCLTIGLSFMALGCWLVFHAGMRASVGAVQMRTRTVRLPVPTQRQLDSARKLTSSYEEQSIYDMFRVPMVMPNLAESPNSTEDDETLIDGIPNTEGKAAPGPKPRKATKNQFGDRKQRATHLPYRPGVPEWIDREFETYNKKQKGSPNGFGNDPCPEPYEHFEILRKAQQTWWGAEVYGRVCMLAGMCHLIQGFGYWLVIHCIAELGMLWCANILAACFSATLWLVLAMDILQEYGGFFPIEGCGPFIAAATLTMQYTHNWTPFIISFSRGMAIFCIVCQIALVVRLYMVSAPGYLIPSNAREACGNKNLSAPCAHPSWLPTGFQPVQYLVPPPLPRKMGNDADVNEANKEQDPMQHVDLFPWKTVSALYVASIVAWLVLLTGRVVECAMGERMLMTNPGQPPWSRIGQWDGWESGPITSKHYAHVTPMRGHFAWKMGQGPNGEQELWPSDLYGFAPEGDAWWADGEVKDASMEAKPGAAVHHIESAPLDLFPTPPEKPEHGERRLRTNVKANVVRHVMPAAVQWPTLLEPEHLVCMGTKVTAVTSNGLAASITADAAVGNSPGVARSFSLHGLPALGLARGISWSGDSLVVVTGTGKLAKCGATAAGVQVQCSEVELPPVPLAPATGDVPLPAIVMEGSPHRAAVAGEGGKISFMELGIEGWMEVAEVYLPYDVEIPPSAQPKVVSLAAAQDHIMITSSDGAAYRWELRSGRPVGGAPHRDAPGVVPAVGAPRVWRSSCALADGTLIRLATRWQNHGAGIFAWHPEILF